MSAPPAPMDLLDVGVFAERLLGKPLWDHQLDLARSPARYRVCCAGRQVGKSTLLAVIALHTAFTRRNSLTLLVSAGETASKRLLDEAAGMAANSPLLTGSVLDSHKSQITLSNGSRILSVPASERQIRGWPVDLLVIDEAGWVPSDIWRAAEPAIIARRGSRVIMTSSPWGELDHFFRQMWRQGTDAPDEHVASWHWPSTASPLVDQSLLERIRQRETPEYYRREFLAEWTDASGAFFTEAELMAATVDYTLTPPDELVHHTSYGQYFPTCAGVDWGVAQDANAVTFLGFLDPRFCQDRRWRLFIPWLRAEYRWAWKDFLAYLVTTTHQYQTFLLASETNGVGSYPSDDLQERLFGSGIWVSKVWTDIRRKQAGFSKLKMLLQSDRLLLPRHPELLKQLRSLEFEQSTTGTMKISVPERAGHDDLAMSLMQAVSMVSTWNLDDGPVPFGVTPPNPDTTVLTPGGVAVPRRPIPAPERGWIKLPEGREKSRDAAW